MNAKGAIMTGERHEDREERRPRPAFRDPELRRTEIVHLVGILLRQSPELLDDISALTEPPPPDERAISAGYGPYGHDYNLMIWNHLATDVVAKEDEIRDALEQVRLYLQQISERTVA